LGLIKRDKNLDITFATDISFLDGRQIGEANEGFKQVIYSLAMVAAKSQKT